ncbi:DgyrCDS4687 [Dimorphilus gyrociliatus]|uniref:DgyrCDS4687 n=1 Tax=Dimorphilus gyrociliatus TaxID=2664684 RepID=A0A7I8VHS5_9ANNE|nr:DgyrCDS4687 [Dimorphilus gyrociliatus]
MASELSDGATETNMSELTDETLGRDNPAFAGATLQIEDPEKTSDDPVPDVEFKGTNFERNIPSRMSTISTTSSRSSRTSMKSVKYPEHTKKDYFCKRDGTFEKAQEHCLTAVVNPQIDGKFISSWLLTEIDHWDNESERIVLLCEESILITRYDFVKLEALDAKRIMLAHIKKIQVGDLTYPPSSWMPARNHGGVRIIWNENAQPSFAQRWNPFCKTIPYVTLIHHPLIYHDKEEETLYYNVDEFFESLIDAANKSFKGQNSGSFVQVEESPIMIECYTGLTSVIFNQSHLGFSRERGGVSF